MSEVISFLQSVQKGMEDNIFNFTKDGKCSKCGNCCSNLLPLSEKEMRTIKRYIKKNHIKEFKNNYPTAIPTVDMTCPFRNNDEGICTIYEVRPEICKQFICGSEQRAKENRALIGSTREIADMRGTFYGA